MNGHTWWWKTRRRKRLVIERPQGVKGITPSEMRELKARVEADPLGEWVEAKEGEVAVTFLGPEALAAFKKQRRES